MALRGLKSEFARIQKDYAKDDALREQVIALSRTILKSSKQAIYALHRDDVTKANKLLASTQKEIDQVAKLLKKYDSKDIGAYNAALEEFVEAKQYVSYVTSQQFLTQKELGVSAPIYLAGLSDCSGELARRAVQLAIQEKKADVQNIYETLEELSELFLDIEFRGIDMRKKLEAIKYNVTKTQNILYDLSVKGR